MIFLDFDNIEISRLDGDPQKWTDSIFFGAFFGNQFLKINDVDFSADYPVLGFARELRAICFRLERGTKTEFYADPEHEHPYLLQFELQGDWVVVSNVRSVGSAPVRSAQIHFDELVSAASIYLEKVISFCENVCPEIKNDVVIRNWLSDLSIPGYQGTL